MKKNKGLLIGIVAALIAFSSYIPFYITMICAMTAMEAAKNAAEGIRDSLGIRSDITAHITTDLIFLIITGIGYLLSLWKIKNESLSFIILLSFVGSIFIFGSDFLFQFERMGLKKTDGQFGFYIFEKVAATGILYPVIGFIYDQRRRKIQLKS
ncbi:hypothetical protein F3J23_06495 [Chryseobacterium sp. Tr-659]|uniref:hypothetical protein n=1 Tax=Chryseobacterium sp. Tr-659 TaxID=2608340 RepID=UPI00141D82D0|nr:hypothetical protein [Chryseobacterium sp. Tr-659]NIF05088.1 hypothetical protein [Chryseobacterium sp. Tr-659]